MLPRWGKYLVKPYRKKYIDEKKLNIKNRRNRERVLVSNIQESEDREGSQEKIEDM